MNKILYLLIVSATIIFIFSCQTKSDINASGTLKDTTGNCLPIVVMGTYFDGVKLGDTNFVQITINVQKTGAYNIKTNVQNGFQFADSGVFNNTGLQTINLKGIGVPSQIQAVNFSVGFDSTVCNFSVNVKDSSVSNKSNGCATGVFSDTLHVNPNQWAFKWSPSLSDTILFSGSITSAIFYSSSGKLTVNGNMASGSSDSLFNMIIEFPGNQIIPCSGYTTIGVPSGPATFNFYKNPSNATIFKADSTYAYGVVYVNVHDYDSVSKSVFCSFGGIAEDSIGGHATISKGSFRASVTVQ